MEPLYILIVLILVTNNIICDDTKVNLPSLNKCCFTNQVVGQRNGLKRVCMDVPKDFPLDFSQIPIFGNDAEKTDKTIYDTFNFVPGKLHSDEGFHNKSINTRAKALRNVNVYLTENGLLYLEVPNAYKRWAKLDHNDFCVDFYANIATGVIKPGFWIREETGAEVQKYNFYTSAMIVSCCFLLVVLIVYAILPELRNLGGLILMAYVASLFVALLCLAIIRIKTHETNVCYGMTLVIYYFFLASICWMNVMSYDIWWTFRGYAKTRPIHRRGEPFKYMMYSLYAWGLPLALTIMLACINASDLSDKPWFIKPNLQKTSCFIEGGEKFLYMYVPMLILICVNWLFFLMTAFNIWRLSHGTSVLDTAAAGTPAAHRMQRQRFLVYLKLTVVMGLNWILEVISFLVPGFRLWYLTDIYNILIGVFIFLIFVCKRKILKKLIKLYQTSYDKSQWYPNTTSPSNTTSSEISQELQVLPVCTSPSKKQGYVVVNNF